MSGSFKTVLIVYENAAMRYFHSMLLMRLQYVVLTASTPDEALKCLESTVPSIIITTAPRLHGTDLITSLKSNDRTKAIPVIVIAGEEDAEIRASYRTMGYASCLDKPVDPHHLYCAIQAETERTPRQHVRINLSLKAAVDSGNTQHDGEQTEYTLSLSEGGCYVRTNARQPKHTLVPIKIFFKDREVKTKAEVIYQRNHNGITTTEGGLGLKFIDMSDNDRHFLHNFITEQLTYDTMMGDLGNA
jgi:DNA-binding response OmpR family regulator